MSIKFGTDGWRAVIADEYTFDNVRKISKATAIAFQNHPKIKNGIVIGYDTRFLSEEFAECAASIFASHGIKVYITDTFVTTPTVSLLTRDKNLAFGIMITSSHNPAKYNGFKVKDEFGGSMGTVNLKEIEKELSSVVQDSYNEQPWSKLLSDGKIEHFDGKKYYVDNLRRKMNIDLIRNSGTKILYDAMYGSGQGMIDDILKIDTIRSEVNPSFGGQNPEPVEKNLKLISEKLSLEDYDIGIVTDGDADRLAVFDEKGKFINAQQMFALLLTYLVDYKKMTGGVVRGFSSSELISKICGSYNLKLYTVPIGFKYISELMVNEDILIGAEESGGIGIKGHLPERDGIFNGLLFCEMLASSKKKMSEIIYGIEQKFGKFYYKRIDKPLESNEKKDALLARAAGITDVNGFKVNRIENLDGIKLLFNEGWLLIRASGTEPLLRLYTETFKEDFTNEILHDIVKKFNIQ